MAIGTLAAIAGAASLAGKAAEFAAKKNKADRDRKLAAETQRYSPWTGMQAGPVEEPNLASSLMEGAAGGLSLAQGVDKLNLGGGGGGGSDYGSGMGTSGPSLGVNTSFQNPAEDAKIASLAGGSGGGWGGLGQDLGMGKPTLYGGGKPGKYKLG